MLFCVCDIQHSSSTGSICFVFVISNILAAQGQFALCLWHQAGGDVSVCLIRDQALNQSKTTSARFVVACVLTMAASGSASPAPVAASPPAAAAAQLLAASPSPTASNRSMSGSPPAGRQLRYDLHPFCYRLPVPKRTGEARLDQDTSANHSLAQQVLDAMISENYQCAPALHDCIMKRAQTSSSSDADCFSGIGKQGSLKAVLAKDEPWVINWLDKHSDMTSQDIIQSKKGDKEAVERMVEFATGINKNFKTPEELMFKPVFGKVLDKLNQLNGNRLVRFKTSNALTANGPVFKHPTGCYGRVYDAKKPNKMNLIHISGDSVEVFDSGITAAFELLDNFSDLEPSFRRSLRSLSQSTSSLKKPRVGPTS